MKDVLDILLAKKGDGENWIEFLIPVIIVIAYAISGILKMRSNLTKEKKSTEKPTSDPQNRRYKPLDGRSRRRQQLDIEPVAPEMSPAQRRQVDRKMEHKLAPEPAPRRQSTPARPKQRKTLEAFLETVAPPKPLVALQAQVAAAQTRERRLRAQTSQRRKAVNKIKPKPTSRTAKSKKKTSVQPSSTDSLTERLAHPDEIRRAIIYAEILGKPIALRDI